MRPCIRPFKNLARGLKFHIWILHKIVDPYFLLHTKFAACSVLPEKKVFEGFSQYMGVAAILVM